jgi:hypothetical protein
MKEENQITDCLNNLSTAAEKLMPIIRAEGVACDSVQTIALGAGSDGKDLDQSDCANSLSLKLESAGLAFQLETRAALTPQLVALATKLEVACADLKEKDGRLANALYRIGYLEAQLAERERELERLQKK